MYMGSTGQLSIMAWLKHGDDISEISLPKGTYRPCSGLPSEIVNALKANAGIKLPTHTMMYADVFTSKLANGAPKHYLDDIGLACVFPMLGALYFMPGTRKQVVDNLERFVRGNWDNWPN